MSCTWRKMKDWYELSLLIYWVVISLVISIWYSHLIVISRHVWTMWFHFSYCAGEPYLFEPYSYEPYFIHSWTKWWYNLEVGLVLRSWSILTTVFQRKIWEDAATLVRGIKKLAWLCSEFFSLHSSPLPRRRTRNETATTSTAMAMGSSGWCR